MGILKFCPQCGQETLQFDGEKKFSCHYCNFVLYHNCAAAVAVVIRCGDEILLTKRNQNPGLGKLDLAGGFVDPKESAENSCAREIYEELGIEIDPKKLKFLMSLPNVYHYKEIDYNTLDLFFEYNVDEKVVAKKLETHEIAEVIWLKISELNIEEIAFDSQRKFLEHYQ